MIVAIY